MSNTDDDNSREKLIGIIPIAAAQTAELELIIMNLTRTAPPALVTQTPDNITNFRNNLLSLLHFVNQSISQVPLTAELQSILDLIITSTEVNPFPAIGILINLQQLLESLLTTVLLLKLFQERKTM